MDGARLSVWRTARDVWAFLFANFGLYIRLSCIPFAIVLAANAVLSAGGIGGAPMGPAADAAELLRHLLGVLIEWIVWLAMAPVATAWIRLFHNAGPRRLAFGAAERAFALRHLTLILLIFATVTLPGSLAYGIGHELRAAIGAYPVIALQAAALPVALAGIVIAFRLSILLPASALGRQLRPGQSWRLIRAQDPSVAGLLILVSLPFVPIQFAVALATDGYTASTAPGLAAVALRKTACLWLAWPVWAATLALLHDRLTARESVVNEGPASNARASSPDR